MSRQDIITAPSDNRFQVDVEANWTESSKVTALMKELEVLRVTGSKSIVFSQWTAFLDLLEIPLKRLLPPLHYQWDDWKREKKMGDNFV